MESTGHRASSVLHQGFSIIIIFSVRRRTKEQKIHKNPEKSIIKERRYELTDVPKDILIGTSMSHDENGRVGTTSSTARMPKDHNSTASQICHVKLFRVSDNSAHFKDFSTAARRVNAIMSIKGQKDKRFDELEFNLKSFGSYL
ncbi:hypothetical protein BPAE_0089g00080 [Botrytis paeoniae]|uniref:Uncharacterized protein n=1 Tax=Botrytis paeoniae TaxID=278948 RepID=A0A4Z1FJR0_9HELO|nr:hypothetical protein BPAE_0089g00080 [Botrytis paeoniae]